MIRNEASTEFGALGQTLGVKSLKFGPLEPNIYYLVSFLAYLFTVGLYVVN